MTRLEYVPYVLPVLLHGCMIPEENLNLPVFRNCTWSWHHLNREVGAATPWIRGPLAHAVRDAHFAHLPPVPILGAVHARDLDLGSGKLLPTAAWPKGNMGAARGLRLVAFLTDAIGDVLQVQDTGPGDLYTWHRNASFAHLTHRPV